MSLDSFIVSFVCLLRTRFGLFVCGDFLLFFFRNSYKYLLHRYGYQDRLDSYINRHKELVAPQPVTSSTMNIM